MRGRTLETPGGGHDFDGSLLWESEDDLSRCGLALVSAFLITAVVFIGIANLGHPYTADSPRHINVRYYEDGKPQWLTDTVTPASVKP